MLRASLLVLVVALVGGGCAGTPATDTAPAPPIVVADVPVADAPVGTTTTTGSEQADTLYFRVEGGAIRLAKSAAGLTPEVAAALAPTEITEARESAELRGPHGAAYHVHLSTAGDMAVAALDHARGQNAAVGGIMFDATHIDLTFAREDAVVPVALSLWEPCAAGLQGIDLPSSLRSAERKLTRDFEARAFSFDDATAADIALRWAGEQGHDVLTAPPRESSSRPRRPGRSRCWTSGPGDSWSIARADMLRASRGRRASSARSTARASRTHASRPSRSRWRSSSGC